MTHEVSLSGYCLEQVALPSEVREAVRARDWERVDALIARETRVGGAVYERMRLFDREFAEIEHIIAIRPALTLPGEAAEPDEDGIWHDDGTRRIAFSLSLTESPERVQGGRLEIRRRLEAVRETASIPTQPFGTMIVFATGVSGYEHRICRVEQGERIVIAGWCS